MFGDAVDPAGEFADYYLRFGVGFADGRKATNLHQRHDFDEGPAPNPPSLRLIRWEVYDLLAWEMDVGVGPAAAGAAGPYLVRSGSPRPAAAACEPCQRGEDPTEPGTAYAELGLDVNLELLVGHLWRMSAQDHQDLDGGWGELVHEPVGQAGGHSARRRPACLRCNRGGAGHGAGRLLLVQGVGQGPKGCGQFTDRAVQDERDPPDQ